MLSLVDVGRRLLDVPSVFPRSTSALFRSRVGWVAIVVVLAAAGCGAAHGGKHEEARTPAAETRAPRLRAEIEFARAHDPRVATTFEGSWITVGGSRAYLAVPVGASAPLPGIVLMHTARGLNRDIQLWSDRLAEEGYAAIAVDLYDGRVADRREDALALRDEANERPEKNEAIIRNAYGYLASAPGIRARRRALVGWSYGAGWATLMASKLPDVNAVVAHYGVADLGPDTVAKIQPPVLLICGDRDETRDDVAAFATSLKTAGKAVQVVWVHADHGFVDPSNVSYDGTAAERTYAEVRQFLQATLR